MCASSLGRAHAWTHPAKPLQPCARPKAKRALTWRTLSGGALVSCARAREQLLGRARPVLKTVLRGFRNNEWHALGARVLVGALVQFGVNWTSPRRGFHVRLASALPWTRPSGATRPIGHRPPTSHCNRRCKEIKANRIFMGQRVADGYDLSHLRPGVMYYCLEDTAKKKRDCYRSSFEVSELIGDDWPSHPRADVFYLTGSGGNGPGDSTGLTLVDITGASGAAETKRANLADWIEAEEDNINALYGQKNKPFVVRGVVLAPFEARYDAKTAQKRGSVDVVFGAKAFALLGGLQQAVGLSED